ncbi:hypothetical protein ACLK1T_25880 [Escherichia coli]
MQRERLIDLQKLCKFNTLQEWIGLTGVARETVKPLSSTRLFFNGFRLLHWISGPHQESTVVAAFNFSAARI